MSANLDLVRSIYSAWERGDFGSADWADVEIDYVIADGPAPGTWTGLADMEEGERHVLRGLAELRVLADEFRELDAERVLVLAQGRGRGKTSGVEISQIDRGSAVVFQLRNGKVRRLVVYFDRDRALEGSPLQAVAAGFPRGNSCLLGRRPEQAESYCASPGDPTARAGSPERGLVDYVRTTIR